ncbi:MAG: pitrilysin family protein [Bryobacteraceae bacterium]
MKRLLTIFPLLACALHAQAPARAVPSYKDLKFPPLRQAPLPNVERFQLSNGMRVFLLENHELPLVSGFALVRTGNLFDPPDKVGLATMTGMVLRTGGSQSRTGDQIDEQLENIAASVESQIDETSGQVSFSALKESVDEVLATFHELMTAPAFRQDKVDLARSQFRSAISRRNDNPSSISSREFAEIVYGGDNPYGWSMEYEHIDRIQRDDLVAFYNRHFFPSNIMLAVTGDFSAPEMRARIEKLFGSWNAQQPPVPPFPPVKAAPSPGIFVAEKPDVNQTFFEMGHLGGVLKDKDYPALEVMADILGGGFRSRLFAKVRTQLGYAYSVSADWAANYGHPGLFRIQGSTRTDATTETLRVIREEVERLRTTPVSQQEMEGAKQSVLNSFVFRFDTPAKTLNRMVIYEYYGYPQDFIFEYQKGIESVTVADVLRVAKQHVRPAEFSIVVVGKPKEFKQPLGSLGLPVKPLDLTIPETRREAAPGDAASLEKGRLLLRKVQAAVGGADKLAGVKNAVLKVAFKLDPAAGGFVANQSNRWLSPGHLRQDSEMTMGKLSFYTDGKTGWLSTPRGTGPLPPAMLKQAQGNLFRWYFAMLLSDRAADRKVNYAGEGVLEISDAAGNLVRLTVDEATGMPLKESYQQMQPNGPTQDIEELYEEMKEVDGIQYPWKVVLHQNGRRYAEATVQELKLNTGMQLEELSKQP